ncbi:MAG TPA: hypothetical protein VKV73_16430 [Chloroflexota bacterium]|nr:hypothetical protein [Chloroflexota bacterium]
MRAWLWAATAGLIVVYLAAAGLSTFERVRNGAEFLYGEAIVLDEVHRIGLGQPLYAPPTALPLTITAYPPLYYLLVAAVQQLTGDPGYGPGRLVSVAAMLVSAGLLAWIVHRVAGGRWSGGLLAAGLFLTQNLTVLLWLPVHRVDPLALCLTLVGLALATSGRTTLAALPCMLAVLTKQTYLAAPLCVLVTLWPRRRLMLAGGAVFVASLSVCLAAGEWLTNGELLWHTVVANANPLDFQYFAAMFGAFLQFNALPLIAALALFGLPARGPERVWRAYFVVSGLEALATIGKLGASSNYWLELTAATCVLIGILAVRLAERQPNPDRGRSPFTSTGLASVIVASLLTCVPAYQATVSQALELHVGGATGSIGPQLEVAPLVAAEPDAVLTDDPGLALLAGKRVEFEFVIFTILATQGVWDEAPIVNAIDARQFGLVVLEESLDEPPRPLIAARLTPRVRAALQAAYTPAGQQAGYWFYRPN